MNISQEGLALIKKFEGCELEAYKCAAGVWTIGYGSTKGVKDGDSITQAEADKLLLHEMEEYEGYINELVENKLKQNEFDALVSWGFYHHGNLGQSRNGIFAGYRLAVVLVVVLMVILVVVLVVVVVVLVI